MSCPTVDQGKERSKPDVFYAISQTKVRREDLTSLKDVERYDHIEKAILSNLGAGDSSSTWPGSN
jgi:hypothetical protein